MACLNPHLAVNLCEVEGKKRIKFFPARADLNINQLRSTFGDDLFLLPCGRCAGCKCDKAKDWAVRCYCEGLYHSESSFITLTYDPQFYPGELRDDHFREFYIKLHHYLSYRNIEFRYFGCAEPGSKLGRWHFHFIIFGWVPNDLTFWKFTKNHEKLFLSETISKLWDYKGFISVGIANYITANYVARYTLKKLPFDNAHLYYSLKPGIGYQYLEDHALEMLEHGVIYGQFGDMDYAPIPTYFEKKLREMYPKEYLLYKNKKLEKAKLTDVGWQNFLKFGHLEEVKAYRAKMLEQKLARIEERM